TDVIHKAPILQKEQETPFVKKQAKIVTIPVRIKVIPPKRWLFFHVVSFFILHTVRRPITEFIRNLGMTFPISIIPMPNIPKISWNKSIGTEERFSTL